MNNLDSSNDEPHFQIIVTTAVIESTSNGEKIRRSSRNAPKRATKRNVQIDFDKIEIVKTKKDSSPKEVELLDSYNLDYQTCNTKRQASCKASKRIQNIMKPSKPVQRKTIKPTSTKNFSSMCEIPKITINDVPFDALVRSVRGNLSASSASKVKQKSRKYNRKSPQIRIRKISSTTSSPLPDLEIEKENKKCKYKIDTLSDSGSYKTISPSVLKETDLGITPLNPQRSSTTKTTSIDSGATVPLYNNLEFTPATPLKTDVRQNLSENVLEIAAQCTQNSLVSCEPLEKEYDGKFEKNNLEFNSCNLNNSKLNQSNLNESLVYLYNAARVQLKLVENVSEMYSVDLKKSKDTKTVQNISKDNFETETSKSSDELFSPDILMSPAVSNCSNVDFEDPTVVSKSTEELFSPDILMSQTISNCTNVDYEDQAILSNDLKKELKAVELHLGTTMKIVGRCLDKIQGPIQQPYIKLYNLLLEVDEKLYNYFDTNDF